MRTAILYICTGIYTQFFDGFYKSCEKYFLPDMDKEYFVFTDDMSLCEEDNVHLLYKQCEGFPKDSLFRFRMFLRVKEALQKFDYIYFFNSNAEFRTEVTAAEVLPDTESGLVGADWPGKRKPLNIPMFFPYERNKKSCAYIAPYGKEYHYYMGGINGGTSAAYIKMIEELASDIDDDFERGIVAVVHDESHINRYFREHTPRSLTPEYCWPEEWPSDFVPKMVFRDKVKITGYFNKGRSRSAKAQIGKLIVALKNAARWYLTI